MTAQPISFPTTKRWPERDDSLEHQIRFIQSPYSGGLGVAVSCACMRRKENARGRTGKLIPLVPRSIESNEDSWAIYHAHLDECS